MNARTLQCPECGKEIRIDGAQMGTVKSATADGHEIAARMMITFTHVAPGCQGFETGDPVELLVPHAG